MRVVVIGAGLAGLCAAHELQQRGAEVEVLERHAGPGLETSFANGSLLHPSLVEPWNRPGVLRELWHGLGQPDSPMRLHLRQLPHLLGWGWRFLRESNEARFRANTLANTRLALRSLTLTQALAQVPEMRFDHYERGSLAICRDAAGLAALKAWRAWLAPHGVDYTALSRDEVLEIEPALRPIGDQIVGGVFHPLDMGGDPQGFCRALQAWLQARGVVFRFGAEVHQLVQAGGVVRGVATSQGMVEGDAVLLCAASWSPRLAASVGLSLPIKPVKGYSLTLPRVDGLAPRVPVIDTDLHMAVVPVGEQAVRVAGTAEFAGFDRSLSPERVANLWRLLRRLYPAYAEALTPREEQGWCGLRPVSPDGVPLIGATAVPGLFLNTGHGHTGWTVAAGAAELAAQCLMGQAPTLDATPYAPGRFA